MAAFFLVGSRALVVQGSDVETKQSKFMQHSPAPQSENSGGPLAKAVYQWIAGPFVFLAAAIIIAHMLPALGGGGGGGRNVENFNYRIPPSWNPDTASHYSFRAFMTDISLWVMLTDLQPHQQCSAIILRLGGQARELARMITPQEIMTGGVRSGVLYDPVSYLLGALQLRFASLDEETRLQSMTEM